MLIVYQDQLPLLFALLPKTARPKHKYPIVPQIGNEYVLHKASVHQGGKRLPPVFAAIALA